MSEHSEQSTSVDPALWDYAYEVQEGRAVPRVQQGHANGCALAVVAMITGETYDEIHALARSMKMGDFARCGVSHHEMDRLLAHHGWFVQRRYASYVEHVEWPPQPWADRHYASVQQPSGNTHFVFVDGHGRVLDPLRPGVYSLRDLRWKVNQVCAVIRPTQETCS